GGDLDNARSHLRPPLGMHLGHDNKRQITHVIMGYARLAAALGDARRALRISGAVEAEHERIGYVLAPLDRQQFDRSLSTAKETIGAEEARRAYAEGRAMTF